MAATTLTIPQRAYAVGVTSVQRTLPGTQRYSHADVSVDFSGWTDPATTFIEVLIDFSLDGGATWQPLVSFTQTSPPPWVGRQGPSSISRVGWTNIGLDTNGNRVLAPVAATNLRGRVVVAGAAATFGPVTLTAS